MPKTIKNKILLIYPHIFPILLFMALEIQNTPYVFRNLSAFILSVVLIYISFWLIFVLTGRVHVSGILVSVTLLTFYTVNFYRVTQTGQVLLPQDLNLTKHVGSLFAFSNMPAIHWQTICSILFGVALNIPLFYVSKQIRLDIFKRGLIFIVLGGFMCLSFSFREQLLSPFITDVLANNSYNDIYMEHGALFGFYAINAAGDTDEPDGYGRVYMETLASKVTTANSSSDGIKPNVIVVMSESFWDPTRFSNITFSEDPIPNLRRLSKTATSGNVITPSFGGMTCNTEFEFLTGHSMSYVGFGDIPYFEDETYIDNDNGRSLVGMFKANGYRTEALHTYTASFFGRDSIYPKLGFDAFIAEENLPNAELKGAFGGQGLISDAYFCDMMIETIENTSEPLFLFGITVQNHTPYLPEKYETTRIQAESGGLLTEEDELFLESYLEGLYDADMVMGRLHDYVMETDTPTILLYFGDHLPLLSHNTGIYTDLGYIGEGEFSDLPLEDAYKMFSTPYVAFSNYARLPATWGDISTYFLGAVLAQAAGINMNLYYHFLVQAYLQFQAMNQYLFIADGGIYRAPRDVDVEIMEMFAAFQYDKLFGNNYLDDTIKVT